MAASPDSVMSDDLPLDPHGEEHIYDVAHSFLYRADDATSALWCPHSPPPHPQAADLVPMAASDAATADADTRPHSMVNLATMGITHRGDATFDADPAPLTHTAFGSDQLQDTPSLDDTEAAGLPSAPDGPLTPAPILPAAWNQDSDDGDGGGDGGGGYHAAADYTSDDDEWQAATELPESEDDEDDGDDDDGRRMWVDDIGGDDDDDEDEDPQESGGLGELGAYNTRTLVGSLLSHVGLHRLVESQQARRSHARCDFPAPRPGPAPRTRCASTYMQRLLRAAET